MQHSFEIKQIGDGHSVKNDVNFTINIPIENVPTSENIDGTDSSISQTYSSPLTQQANSISVVAPVAQESDKKEVLKKTNQ